MQHCGGSSALALSRVARAAHEHGLGWCEQFGPETSQLGRKWVVPPCRLSAEAAAVLRSGPRRSLGLCKGLAFSQG